MKKHIALFAFFFSLQSAVAQRACCSATLAFNNLSEDSQFQEKHSLKEFTSIALKGEMIDIPVEGAVSARAYVLKTKIESDKYVFVFHEWWGLNDHIKAEADRYYSLLKDANVIALDLYDGKVATTREDASKYMKSANQDRVFKIIDAASNWAGAGAKIATIGWCFGGGWSMQSSLAIGEKAAGCVVFYGMPENDAEKLKQLRCEVLGIFASEDLWINREVVSGYETAMKSASKAYETFWYEAAHAFANPSNAKYNAKCATQANAKALEFLMKSLDINP